MLCRGMYFDLKMNSFCVRDRILPKSYRFKMGLSFQRGGNIEYSGCYLSIKRIYDIIIAEIRI